MKGYFNLAYPDDAVAELMELDGPLHSTTLSSARLRSVANDARGIISGMRLYREQWAADASGIIGRATTASICSAIRKAIEIVAALEQRRIPERVIAQLRQDIALIVQACELQGHLTDPTALRQSRGTRPSHRSE